MEDPKDEVSGNATDNLADMSHKFDMMVLNNGWNDKNELLIISIGENAASYKWMHEKAASFYKLVNQILSIILIVFSTGLSAESIIPAESSSLGAVVSRRVFTYILTVISVLQSFLKYEKVSEQHISSAVAFGRLYHDIQQQMCMFRRDRNNSTKYVSDILKQYDTLIVNGPQISNQVIKQFKTTFKNTNISVPDIADRIQKIEIITEQANTSQTNRELNNICNLNEISNAFQIHGDISDKDLQNATSIELKGLLNKRMLGRSDFEYQRFLQHSQEND